MAIQYATNDNFNELVDEDFAIVDFYSDTCVPCKMFAKILENLDGEIPFLNIVKVNTSSDPELGDRFKIQAVPTVMFFKDGDCVETHLGVLNHDQVKERISKYMYE